MVKKLATLITGALLLTTALVSQAFAATEFVCTIMQSGGDYSILNSWAAANQCNLTTSVVLSHGGKTGTIVDGSFVKGATSGAYGTATHATSTQICINGITGTFVNGEVINKTDVLNGTPTGTGSVTATSVPDSVIAVAKIDGAWTAADTTAVTINGWTTSATNYIKIYTTTAARHTWKWDTTKYNIAITATAIDTKILDIKENYVRIEGLQAFLTNSAGYAGCKAINIDSQDASSDIRLSHNIVKGAISGAFSEGIGIYGNDADITAKIYNNIIYDFINGAVTNNAGVTTTTGGSYYLYNNTFQGSYIGVNAVAGIVIAINNIFSGCTTAASGTFAAGTNFNATNNVSMGYTVTGGGNVDDKLSQAFAFVAESTDNFHLAINDTAAKDAGLLNPGSGLFFDDIDGDTRIAPWDIGADEYLPCTFNITATLDTVVPDAPVITAFTTVGGTVEANKINATNTGFSVTFTSPAANYAGTAHLYVDGSLLANDLTAAVLTGGTSHTITGNQQAIYDLGGDGTKVLTVKIIDAAGNVGAVSNPWNITKEGITTFYITATLDNTYPAFTIGYYTDSTCITVFTNNYMKVGTYYIKISASEAIAATPTISINAEGTVNDVTNAATSLLSGNDYVYTRTIAYDAAAVGSVAEVITITATDVPGNIITNADVTDEKYTDTVAPNAPVISSIATDYYINNSEKAAIIVAGTAAAGSTVNVTLSNGINSVSNSGTAAAGSYSITLNGTLASPAPLADGIITPSVTATDVAGNVSSPTATPTAIQDTAAPTVPSAANITVTQNLPGVQDKVSGSIGAVEGSAIVRIYKESGLTTLLGSGSTVADGSFTTIDIGDNQATSDLIYIVAVDAAGNVSGATSKTNDTTAPTGLANLAVASVTSTSVMLTWTPASDNQFNHYEIWYGTSFNDVQSRTLGAGAAEWDNTVESGGDTALATATTNTTTITGLTAGLTYHFKIWAVDNAGNEQGPVSATAPAMSSWALNMNTGVITLSFSETMNASTLVVTKVILQDAATATVGKSYTLTNSTGSVTNSTTITITLSTTDLNAIKAIDGLAKSQANSYIRFSAAAIADIAGNNLPAILDGSAVQCATGGYIADSSAPTLSNWALNMNTQTLELTFNEPVAIGTFDKAKFKLQSDAAGTNTYTLAGTYTSGTYGSLSAGQYAIGGTSNLKLQIKFTTADFNDLLDDASNLAEAEASSYLVIAALSGIQDKAATANALAAVSATQVATLGYTANTGTAVYFKVTTTGGVTSTSMTAGSAAKTVNLAAMDAFLYRTQTYGGASGASKTIVFSGASASPDPVTKPLANNLEAGFTAGVGIPITFTKGLSSTTVKLFNRETALIKATDTLNSVTTLDAYALTIVVNPEIKNKLVFTQQPPSTGTINVALNPQPRIEIRDVYGNRTDDTDSITLYDSTTKPIFNDGPGTLANASISAVAGTATFSAVAYNRITSIYLQAKATGLTSVWSDSTITFSAAGTTTVDAAAAPVANFNLLAINDTEVEKFAALKFKVTDAGGDQTPTLIDQIKIAVSGTGGVASTDIAWAGLYKTNGTVLVQTATSIANDFITFGSALNADSTAALDSVTDNTNTEYMLFIYMKQGKLTATDTKTYTFGVHEGLIGVDSGTSSQMWTPARTAVATVVGTVKVDVTYLEVVTAAGAATASTTVGTALELTVRGVDVNKNIDIHYGLAPDGENKTLKFSGLNSIAGNDPVIEASPFGANITISFLNGVSAANAVTLTAYRKETQNMQADEYDAYGVSKYLAYPLAITVDALKASTVTATSGDGQVGKTSTALPTPLLVTATDTYGNTVAGVNITFAITAPADGASLSVSSGTTDAVGQLSTVLTLGTVSKTYTVTATATGPVDKVIGSPAVSFTATGRTPTAISKTGDNQTQNISTVLASAFVAKLVDAAGNPIPNETITFAFPTGGYPTGATGQAISVSSGTTNSSGQVSTVLTLGNKIGSYIVRATYSGGPTITTDFTATATTTGPSTVGLSAPTSITADAASAAFTISITDDAGNTAAITDAVGVTFNLTTDSSGVFYSDSGCTIQITTKTVLQNASSAQFYYKQTVAGTVNITVARASGQVLSTKSTDSKAVSIVPADLDHFRLTGSAALTAGVSTTLTIKAYDVYNNLRTNFSSALNVRFKFNDILSHSSPAGNNPTCGAGTIGNNSTAGDAVSLTFSSGTATASLILYKPETTLVLKAYTDTGITTSDAYDLDVASVQHNSADHTKLSGNLPTPQTVGVAFNFGRTLNVVDAYDNICDGANGGTAYNETPTGNNVTWTLSGTANSPDGSYTDSFIRQVTFTSGVSTTALSATLYRAQDTTLTAAVAGVPAIGSPLRANQASNLITVTAGAINKLWFSVAPSSTAITSQALAQQPSVSVADVYGNATSASGSITLAAYLNNTGADTAGNGTLSSDQANNTKTLVNGVAAFTGVKYSYPETIYLKATVAGQSLTAVYSAPVALSVATDLTTTSVTTSSTISSIKNAAADKVTVYEFKVTDAGTDGRDGTLTKILINRDYGTGGGDTAGDWTNYINGAWITDGTTQVIGTVAANSITFGDASSTLYTVSNGTNKTLSLKLTLKTSLPTAADGKKLGFTMDANTDISIGTASSNFAAVSAITGTATVTVTVTDLVITGTATMTAGASNTITLTAKDANANIDLDYENLTAGKVLIFSGANASSGGNNPTCSDYGNNDIAFGTATSVRFTAGVGSSTMKLYKAETAAISVTDGTISTQSGSTLSVTVSSSTIAKLSWSTQPAVNVVTNAPWKAFVLAVADTYGNTLTTSTESVTISLSGATGDVAIDASATKTATASAGVATFNNFYVTGTGTTKLMASAGVYSSAASSTVTVAASYTVNITVKDSFSNATLTDVQLEVTKAGTTVYSPSTSASGQFSLSLTYGTHIFKLRKEAYVDSDTESTTSTAADGTDGTYDNVITWTLSMTSVTEATADYKVMSSFIYDEVGEDLTIRLWLERRGILIVNSAMNILGNATVDVYDSTSAAWLTTITISPPAASDTTTGTYTKTVENVLSASSSFGKALTTGKSYFAKCKISYGGTTGTRKTYEAGTTFTISVTEKLSREIIDKLGVAAGETLVGKIAEVKSETAKIVTATETTIPGKVAEVKTETAKILTAAETTIPAKVDEAKTALTTEVVTSRKSEILNRENTVRSGQPLTIRYRTYTGLSPTIDVYDGSNVLKVSNAAMTEIGTTGIYEKTVTFESVWGRGDFSIVCSETTKGTMDAMTISVLRTDMEQVYGQVSSILGNTSGITGLRTVADSLNNQFAVIESVLSKVGKNLVAQVKEAASSALGLESIFTQLANVAKQVKQISGEAGINLEKLYAVSVDKKQDIDYLKNKTQQLKASVELSTKMVDNIANKPITQTWYEYKK